MSTNNDTDKLLYCSFCGKSQHEVKTLIAGPAVYVCDECTSICVDVMLGNAEERGDKEFIKDFSKSIESFWKTVISPEGVDTIIREIQFPPEYQQAGITILSNFSSLIRRKYKDQKIKVSIQQQENLVILIVEGENGMRERIEEVMSAYSLVLQGKEKISSLSDDPYEVAQIRQQLRIAQLQIENQRELLEIEKRHSHQLLEKSKDVESQYREMIKILSASLEGKSDLDKCLHHLLMYSFESQSKTAKLALKKLSSIIESGRLKDNEGHARNELLIIKKEDPGLFNRLSIFAESCAAGVVGNSIYSWLLTLTSTLPK